MTGKCQNINITQCTSKQKHFVSFLLKYINRNKVKLNINITTIPTSPLLCYSDANRALFRAD